MNSVILKKQHEGCALKFKVKVPGGGYDEFIGKVHFQGSVPVIFGNSKYLDSGGVWVGNHPYPQLPYYRVFENGMISRETFGNYLASVDFDGESILYKHDTNGGLFRRIHRIDGEIIFLGPIRKDPEECKKPSSIIQTLDYDFLKAQGWTNWERETSAEDKVKNKKVVNL